MTTPRDLLIIALDDEGSRAVRAGELSLALAGAELIDLLMAPTIRLDGGRIVPGHLPALADPILKEAAASFVMAEPFESVGDFLWRRGKSLTERYMAALEAEGVVARRGGHLLRKGRTVLVDSLPRRQATERWDSAEPVLSTLAKDLGIRHRNAIDPPDITDYAVEIVLAAANRALQELEGERQRRRVEQAAFDNIWRSLD
ncbi:MULTISPECIES: GPP34 family phosphoprotein [unclassified Streptomyces]|uniref:GOLPH3/VPS74 family protein n=1 Tax=unclassified Streptomyces TaxID=2593676 RepID=UPI00225B656D|nr:MULTISPECIES: GPP34 family phosphoprotein [unclassified Streptomyces]MCX5315770.1 GPP34 family phosphoprotein [Streptomyces sp. NBC_00154]WSC34249.1 GPP34 family phosphoprotein [Streptomyces sp. NBC_01763]WSC41812.1 GPP34 family phosphoprotein [Streptomyces sp. NBC_01763]